MGIDTLNDTTYATAARISQFLNVDTFTATTANAGSGVLPNQGAVEELILEAEGEIDRRTGHSWKSTLVSLEVYDMDFVYWDQRRYRPEIPLYLQHRNLRTLASGTHKIEVWQGNAWLDLVANATEGRNSDYWVDLAKGVVWFVSQRPHVRKASVRMTYAYGDSTVPKDIQRAATLLAASYLVSSDDYSRLDPEGADSVPLATKAESWRTEAEKILSRREELKAF